MSERLIGGQEWPRTRWTDPDLADAADAADEAHAQEADPDPDLWPDVEWSADQSHMGEFGCDPMSGAVRD